MKPILFSFGSVHIHAYGLLIALGVLCALYLMNRAARETGFPRSEQVFDLVFITLVAGFLGARLFYVLQNLDWYLPRLWEIPAFWQGGLIFYGGLVTAFLALVVFMRRQKMALGQGFDFLLPYVALVHAFGRMGCFFNGCCYGIACDLPWAVQFPHLDHAVHPTQLYEVLWNLGLFILLRALYVRRKRDGEISVLYFTLYAFGRFLIEYVRADNPVWGPFTGNQWISLGVVGVAGVVTLWMRRHARQAIR